MKTAYLSGYGLLNATHCSVYFALHVLKRYIFLSLTCIYLLHGLDTLVNWCFTGLDTTAPSMLWG